MGKRSFLVSPAASPGGVLSVFGRVGAVVAVNGDYTVSQVTGAAPLASPALTGVPTAPTAAGGTNTTQLATTAFVQAALPVVAVTSVFGRTGAVVATNGDYTVSQVTGAAPLASPALTGVPTAPTAAGGTNTTQLATTAFVQAALPAVPVASVFGRTGVVVANTGDYTVAQVTGAAPLASPTFTGTPAAPTPAPGDNSTTLATTAFVAAALGPQLQSVVVTLTNAQILALPTTFPQIVAAPGAGKMIVCVSCVVTCDATAGVYTNINAAAVLTLQWGTLASGTNSSQSVFQGIGTRLTKLLATASKNITVLNEVGQTSAASGNFLEAVTPAASSVFDNLPICVNISNAAAGNLTGGNAANSMKVTLYYLTVQW